MREEYGQPYGKGDVVGCLLHLGQGGRPFEKGVAGRWAGGRVAAVGMSDVATFSMVCTAAGAPQPVPHSCTADVVKYKSKLFFTGDEPAEPQRLPGSFLAFTLNGQLQVGPWGWGGAKEFV